jgi:hypothetical protein
MVQHTCGRLPEEAGRQLTVGQKWTQEEGKPAVLVRESLWARRWHGGDPDAFLAYVYGRKSAKPVRPSAGQGSVAVASAAATAAPQAAELAATFGDAITAFEQRMTAARDRSLQSIPDERVDAVFAGITAGFEPELPAERPVPEPLATIVERFGKREFVSTDDLAKAVGMEPAALGLLLSREPFSITRDSKAVRRPEYEGKPTRGFFMSALLAAAEEFRTGKRSAS